MASSAASPPSHRRQASEPEPIDVSDAEEDSLQCASYNQDGTHLAVGWRRAGWRVFTCTPFTPCVGGDVGIGVVQMLFSSSLIALVGCGERAGDSPRRLRLWNTSTAAPVFELPFASDVLNMLMNRTRLVVVLAQATHVFELATMRMLHTLETELNKNGLAALTWEEDASLCAVLPTPSSGAGRVLLFDAAHGHANCTIAAHHTALAAMALSARGEMLATASEKGTVVRVHSATSGQLLHTFRRGTMRATIHSLAFSTAAPPADGEAGETGGDVAAAEGGRTSPAGGRGSSSGSSASLASPAASLLCAASSTGTVHVWRLDEPKKKPSPRKAAAAAAAAEGPSGSSPRSGGATARKSGPLGGVREWLGTNAASAQAQRDLCSVHVKLPPKTSWCRAALRDGGGEDGKAYLSVVSERGAFYVYALDVHSGACNLMDERRLLPSAQ